MTFEIGPGGIAAAAGCFGLLVGSFLNVVVHRVPNGESIVFPASRCPRCETKIRPWDNVPVLSYLWLRGHCRDCRSPIALRYPAVELLTGLIFAAIAWRFGPTGWSVLYCAFAAALLAAALIDHDHRIIPDSISLGGLAAALVLVPAMHAVSGDSFREAFLRSLAGACVGAGLLWLVAFLHARISVAIGREFEHWPGEGESLPRPNEADYWLWFPGLGLGDVKLLGMIGAVVGPAGVLDTILASSIVGLVFGGAQALARGALGRPFGFAPAIAVGAVAMLFLPPLWMLAAY